MTGSLFSLVMFSGMFFGILQRAKIRNQPTTVYNDDIFGNLHIEYPRYPAACKGPDAR
jgi:hypothetical protein